MSMALLLATVVLVRFLPHGGAVAGGPATSGAAVSTSARTVAVGSGTDAGAPAGATIAHPEIGFRSHARLAEHYQKHGREFGPISMDDYLGRAQVLRDAALGGEIIEARRGDGIMTRYDRSSGAFLAFGPDDVIHTFFKPNDGEAYFHRQLEREH